MKADRTSFERTFFFLLIDWLIDSMIDWQKDRVKGKNYKRKNYKETLGRNKIILVLRTSLMSSTQASSRWWGFQVSAGIVWKFTPRTSNAIDAGGWAQNQTKRVILNARDLSFESWSDNGGSFVSIVLVAGFCCYRWQLLPASTSTTSTVATKSKRRWELPSNS